MGLGSPTGSVWTRFKAEIVRIVRNPTFEWAPKRAGGVGWHVQLTKKSCEELCCMPPPMLSRLVLPLELSREAQEGFGGQRPTSGLRPRPLAGRGGHTVQPTRNPRPVQRAV